MLDFLDHITLSIRRAQDPGNGSERSSLSLSDSVCSVFSVVNPSYHA